MEQFIKKEDYFLSSDGVHKIFYYLILPLGRPKALFQFCHGLAEHGERYMNFASFLASNGVAFCMHDSLGHKKSVLSDDELGFYGKKDGWKYLYKDMLLLTNIIRSKFPSIPLFLGGHSMGSFIARACLPYAKFHIDGAVFIGTGNATAAIRIGTSVARIIGLFKGKTYRSKLLDNLSFGAYNKKIPNPKTGFDWLSVNENNVSDYVADKYCGFISTCEGFVDVSLLIRNISKQSTVSKINPNIPLLFLSGAGDPVGNYGKLVNKAAKIHIKSGAKDVTVNLLDDARHEVLNDNDSEETYRLILNWLSRKATFF